MEPFIALLLFAQSRVAVANWTINRVPLESRFSTHRVTVKFLQKVRHNLRDVERGGRRGDGNTAGSRQRPAFPRSETMLDKAALVRAHL